jgi:hypothetical protein
MHGLTRGTVTLISAAVAGLLIWIATQINDHSTGGYWAVYGLIAAAGLTMALSQLLGGWTNWGRPRMSVNVFLLAFIPTLIAAGWVIVAHQPHGNWFRGHVLNWSDDISILNVVRDLTEYVSVLAFGIGLLFGFSFDTAGPAEPGRPRRFGRRRREEAAPAGEGAAPASSDGRAARERPRERERESERETAGRR